MKRFLILACVLALVVWAIPASAGDYTRHNALEIQRTTGDDYEDRDTYRYEDSDGNLLENLDEGLHKMRREHPVIVDLGGTSIYTIDKTNGSEFWIDDYLSTDGSRGSGSGVSILLPKITAAYDGYRVKIMKMTTIAGIDTTAGVTAFSGTTDLCVSTVAWSSGTTDHIWNVTTGVTNETAAHVMPEVDEADAVGDWLEFTAVYGVSGSTWYQTGRYIQ